MLTNQEAIDCGLESLRSLVEEDPGLKSEFENSRIEFFNTGDLGGRDPTDTLAARRHLEWFLLERHSERLGALPVEVLLERGDARSPGLAADRVQAFLGSHCSVFEVTAVEAGEGMWMRDLARQGEYAIVEREASALLRAGDLIVGRIFPVGDSLHHVSRAASFFRNPELLAALHTDLGRARESRRGVLRLTQSEVESMFYAPRSKQEPLDAVGEARTLLLNGGLSREDVDDILEQLASERYSGDAILPGAHDTLGEVLDRLAFESTVDLESARHALLHAWAEMSRSGPGSGTSLRVPSPGSATSATTNIADAVAAFERKRKNGESLDRALLELEQALALGSASEDEEETPAPDFPGVVGAMIEEFLWETAQQFGPDRAREMECLRSFGQFASSVGVFENLSSEDLFAYTCRWLPESDELRNADSARRLLSALRVFCRWAEENHDVPIYSTFKSTLHTLQDSLPRLTEANRRRTREATPGRGDLFECVALDTDGRTRLRDQQGVEHEVRLAADLGMWLQIGDRIRGHVLGDGRVAVYCCYPAELDTGRATS